MSPRDRARAHLDVLRVAAVSASLLALAGHASAGDPRPPTPPPPKRPIYAVVDELPPPAVCGDDITRDNLGQWVVARAEWRTDERTRQVLVTLSWYSANEEDGPRTFEDVRIAGGRVLEPPQRVGDTSRILVYPDGPDRVQVSARVVCEGQVSANNTPAARVEGTMEWELDVSKPDGDIQVKPIRFVDLQPVKR